jgi:hypothetical protein
MGKPLFAWEGEMLGARSSVLVAVLAVTGAVVAGPAADAQSQQHPSLSQRPTPNKPAASHRLASGRASSSPWSNIGPLGGDVTTVAVDPKTPTTLYAGTYAGSVFKSVNSGTTWAPAGVIGTNQLVPLAVDPTTDSTLYAGTYAGFYVSTNSGATWTLNAKLGSMTVDSIAVDPNNGSVVYVAVPYGSGAGVWVTTNGGGSWTKADSGLTTTNVNEVVVAPSTPSTLYAATAGGGVFVSTNSASTWTAVNSGLVDTGIQSLAVDPTNASSVWAVSTPIANFAPTVSHTTTGGTSWSTTGSGLPAPSQTLHPVAEPLLATSSAVYVGVESKGVYEEANTATSWSAAAAGMTDPDGLATANVYSLAAAGSALYAGSEDGGMFKSTNGAGTWAADNTGLLGNTIDALAGVPTNQNLVYTATDTLGLFVSSDGGKTWVNAKAVKAAIISTIAVDPSHPSAVWAGGNLTNAYPPLPALFKTIDNGLQWGAVNGPGAGVSDIAVDPFDSNIVYVATQGKGVYETQNGGSTWTQINHGLTNLNVSVISADSATKGRLYAGTGGSGVFTSSNGGSSWTQMPTTGLTDKNILSIVDGETVVGTASGVSVFNEQTKQWSSAKFYKNGQPYPVSKSCYVRYKLYATAHPWVIVRCGNDFFWQESGDVGSKGLNWTTEAQYLAQAGQNIVATADRDVGDPLLAVGTSGKDIFAFPSSLPIFTASAQSKTATGSATATVPPGQKADIAGSLSAVATTGVGTVTANDYFADPSSVNTSFLSTNFFGASLSGANTFHSVTIEDCQVTDRNTLVYWLQGTKWVKVSKQSYQSSTGCVLVTVTTATIPSLKNLGSAVFSTAG